MVFILVAMFSASFIMGGAVYGEKNGWFFKRRRMDFGIVLAVLAFTVARSTYRVNDAIAVDLNTKFTHE